MGRYKYDDNFDYTQHSYMGTANNDDAMEPVVLHKRGFVSGLFGWIRCLVICVILIVVLLVFFFRPVTVVGDSMEDTLAENDTIILTNFLYTPQQGDVVVINADNESGESTALIARVIAVGGQSISIEEDKNRVLVDGKIIDEPYVKGETTTGIEWDVPSTIPDGYVFVMGDNRDASVDSRHQAVGLVHESDIIGKAQFLVYPFDRISVIG